MRLWSVHPRYLDRQGLTAAWREGLLAQKVLTGTTTGYRHHPQLLRFGGPPSGTPAAPTHPGVLVTTYLHALVDEAEGRGYRYVRAKVLGPADATARLEVSDGQLAHEWAHLRAKLALRSPDVLARWSTVALPDPHPMMVVVPGPVADWEVVTDLSG